LIIVQDVFFNTQSEQLVAPTIRDARPAISQLREFAVAGGLISYGVNRGDAWRQAGIFVGRIPWRPGIRAKQASKFGVFSTITLKCRQ
jgi:putative ABC transport system substrate-binding protein